jgi:hypothetical protein
MHDLAKSLRLKNIAAIEDPPVIVKILAHLGLPTRSAPSFISCACPVDLSNRD